MNIMMGENEFRRGNMSLDVSVTHENFTTPPLTPRIQGKHSLQ